MTSAHDVHPELDAAIDAVAREMTRGETPSMRAAVLARLLDEPRRAEWRWFPAIAAAAVAIVLATAVVAITSMDRAMAPDTPLTAIATSSTTIAAAEPLRPIVAPLAVEDARVDPMPAATHQPDTPAFDELPLSATETAWLERALPALTAQAPLALDVIQPQTVEITLLGMTPLEPAPLAMAPLNIRRAGDPR